MVVEERDNFRERLPDRLPELLLRQALAQAADDIAHPASEHLRQLLLHPVLAPLGGFPEQGVGCAPEVANDVQNVQHKRHALPLQEEFGRQAPQTEGTVEQHDQGFAVLGIAALRIPLISSITARFVCTMLAKRRTCWAWDGSACSPWRCRRARAASGSTRSSGRASGERGLGSTV